MRPITILRRCIFDLRASKKSSVNGVHVDGMSRTCHQRIKREKLDLSSEREYRTGSARTQNQSSCFRCVRGRTLMADRYASGGLLTSSFPVLRVRRNKNVAFANSSSSSHPMTYKFPHFRYLCARGGKDGRDFFF